MALFSRKLKATIRTLAKAAFFYGAFSSLQAAVLMWLEP